MEYTAPTADCQDVTSDNNAKCYKHLQWAISQGKTVNASFYPKGTATDADFQCALFLKMGPADGPSWECHKPPCAQLSASLLQEGGPKVAGCMAPKTMTTTTEALGPSFPVWAWVLTAVGLAAIAALVAYLLGVFDKKKPKKKRAVKIPDPEPEPVQTTMTSVPVYVAPPVYTTVAPPVYTAAPVYTTAPEVITAPPVYTSSSVVVPAAAAHVQCSCGNIFMDDAVFCRKCGKKRP